MNSTPHSQYTGSLFYACWSSIQNDASQAITYDFTIPLANSRNKSINYSIRGVRYY